MRGGFDSISATREPTTEKGKELKEKLWIYLFVYIGITVIKLFVLGGQAFMDLFNALFLYCGINSMNPCMLAFFIFLAMFSLFELVTILGTLIQHGTPLFSNGMGMSSILLIASLGITLYGFWLIYESYKEFKADIKENGGGTGGGFDTTNLLGGMNMGGDGGGNNAGAGNNNTQAGGGGGNFTPFQGQGVALG